MRIDHGSVVFLMATTVVFSLLLGPRHEEERRGEGMGGGFGYLWFVLSSQALSTARLVQFTAASSPI